MGSGNYDWIFSAVFGGLFMLAAAFIVGVQVVGYLYDGFWVPLSLVDFLQWFWNNPWLSTPESWVGLHRVVDMIPASLTLAAIGYFIWIADDL